MGKRSNFERIPRDFYPTPYAAVPPLIPHLRGVQPLADHRQLGIACGDFLLDVIELVAGGREILFPPADLSLTSCRA